MKIGIVARSLARKGSGVRRYIVSIVDALLSIDDKNEYVIYYDNKSSVTGNPRATEKVIQVPTKLLWDHVALPLAVRRDKVDVLFCMRNVVPLFVSCKSVATVHDLVYIISPRAYAFKDTLYMNLGLRWTTRRADAIISVSRNTKDDLVKRLGAKPEKVFPVHEGVSATFTVPDSADELNRVRELYQLPDEFILSIASIEPRKNLDGLLRAFAILKRETEAPHKLVLIGSIPWRSSAAANLEGAIGSLSMESEVVRLAYVPEEDLPKIYNLATALAFTSLYEGFGLPALEAMACGCPVVCSNSSSLPEVVGDAGILVDPTDEKDIAEGLSRVIGDSGLRKDMIARGLERAAEFSWERAAKETLCVLEDVYVQSR